MLLFLINKFLLFLSRFVLFLLVFCLSFQYVVVIVCYCYYCCHCLITHCIPHMVTKSMNGIKHNPCLFGLICLFIKLLVGYLSGVVYSDELLL